MSTEADAFRQTMRIVRQLTDELNRVCAEMEALLTEPTFVRLDPAIPCTDPKGHDLEDVFVSEHEYPLHTICSHCGAQGVVVPPTEEITHDQ